MSFDPDTALLVCLVVFVGLSFLDGIVIHLWRERLHARPESQVEHALHTGRALLFPLILVAFFEKVAPAFGLALILIDQGLEIVDMAVERRSRVHSGGLRTSEYVLHGILITLRAVGITLALFSGDPSAALIRVIDALLPGAIVVAILHVVLMMPSAQRATA